MRNIRLLATVAFLYAAGFGLASVATPLVCLNDLGMSSEQLGLITAGGPLGYAIGCALFGQVLRRFSSKRVLIAGEVFTIVSVFGIFLSRTVWNAFFWQFVFGLAQGAVWPFLSAWMLSFTGGEIPKVRALRYYNVAWTSGTALGMYAGGVLCDAGYAFPTFKISMAVLALSTVVALLPESQPVFDVKPDVSQPRAMSQVSFAILSAAVIANVSVIGTRAMANFNYTELNKFHGFGGTRIGTFAACALGGQWAAFIIGRLYESQLGTRRIYAFIGFSSIAANLCMAYVTNIVLLTAVMMLTGVVAAMAFQAAIIAAVGWFSSPRIGTTISESIIGAAQMVSLVAGWAIQRAKDSGCETLSALRLPFLVMAGFIAAGMLLQFVLVTSRKPERMLIPAQTAADPGI